MILAGIVAEYNPFHNGHEFHIARTRELTGADCIAIILSGDFVQRGEPAIMDKFLRAKCALSCGADLVIELPVPYALSSAEQFAAGAVSILSALRADYISFGSECGNIRKLTEIAHVLCEEPAEFQKILKENLRAGISFPKARDLALSAIQPQLAGILASPNNTLGIEYIKEIHRKGHTMRPITIMREGSGYSDASATIGQFPSATAIRHLLQANDLETLAAFVPPPVLALMRENIHRTFPISADDFSTLLYYRLTQLTRENTDFTRFLDVSSALANRIVNMIKKKNRPRTFYETAEYLKTKELTHSRIMRCLMHILLDIRSDDMDMPGYIRILGLNETGGSFLSGIKKDCSLPIITKPAAAKDLLQKSALATSVYNQVVYQKYNTLPENDFTHNIVLPM